MADPFELHPRLAADTFAIADLELCRVLLMNDRTWPWCILVPRRAGIREIHELSEADQILLVRESSMIGRGLMKAFDGFKLNVAALGNVVPQLHVHHIVRHENDPAWPGPVWGRMPPAPYDDESRRTFVQKLRPHVDAGAPPSA